MTEPTPRFRPRIDTVRDALAHGTAFVTRGLTPAAERKAMWQQSNREHFQRSLAAMGRHEQGGRLGLLGTLFGEVVHADGSRTDLGLMSCRVVTDTGVQFIVDSFQGLTEPELMRYHGLGTGTTAEAANQTALVTELTTQYSTANTRPQGSLGEQSGVPNTYETVATVTMAATAVITEHAIFSQASAPGGVMLDRSVFAAITLNAAESLQVTYRLQFPSGG